jgi:hypothetical protein
MSVKAWPEHEKIIYIYIIYIYIYAIGFDIYYVNKTLGYSTCFFYSELTMWEL